MSKRKNEPSTYSGGGGDDDEKKYYKKGSPSRSGKGPSSKQYPPSQTPHTNESSKFIIETSDSWSQRTQRTKQLHEQLVRKKRKKENRVIETNDRVSLSFVKQMSQTRGLLNKLSNKNFSSVSSQLVAIANNNTEVFLFFFFFSSSDKTRRRLKV